MDRPSVATPPPPSAHSSAALSSPLNHRDRAIRASSSSAGSSGSRPDSPSTGGGATSSSLSTGSSSSNSGGGSGSSGSGLPGSGLFGWVKSAFAAPNRNTSSSPRASTPRQSDMTMATTSRSSSGQIPGAARAKAPLPSRNLESEFQERKAQRHQRDSYSSASGTSFGHESIDEEEAASDEDDDDDDEELYVPFASSDPVEANTAPAAAAAAPPGVVRPTARRTVSLDHGDKEGLDAEVARLNLAGKSRPRTATRQRPTTSKALTVDEAETGAVVSDVRGALDPPSLVLTPPDSRSAQRLASPPLIAGWSSNESSGETATYSSVGGGTIPSSEIGDGESIEAAAVTAGLPRASKEIVALGSRAVALRTMEEEEEAAEAAEDEAIEESSLTEAASAEEWDESRSKTPRVLADVVGQSAAPPRMPTRLPSYKGGDDLDEDVTTPTEEFPRHRDLSSAAQEIHDSAAPTPKPDQGGRGFGGQHQRWAASEPGYDVSILKAPKPVAPARRRFFGGGRRRADSAEHSIHSIGDDAPADDSGSGTDAVPRRNRVLSGSSSAAAFWRRRKPSESSPRPSTSHSSMSPSSSAASGMSFEIPDSETAASSTSGSRPPSIAAPSSTAWAPSTTKKVKIRASGGGLGGSLNPRKIKSRTKGKSSADRQFGCLYLAQELDLCLPSPEELAASAAAKLAVDEPSSTNGSSSSPASSTEFGQLPKRDPYAPPPERPRLGSANSQSSMQSSLSMSSTTAGAFSTTSHSTTGSYGAHGKKKATWALKFSLDGKYLAVAGQDAVVRVFQVLDCNEKRDVELRESQARADAFYAERSFAASHDSFGSLRSKGSGGGGPPSSATTGSFGRTKRSSAKDDPGPPLRPMPVFTSKPIREFRGHTSDVLSLDWSKNNFLLSSSMDKTVKVWHLSKPDCLITFGHGDFVTSAVFHPKDDRFFLSGSLDGKLRLWNIAAKRVQASADVPGLITATAFSASGTTAIAGTFSGALLFYGTEDLSYQSSIAVRSSSGKNARGRKITGIEALGSTASSSSSRVEEKILISSNDSRIRVYSLTDKRLTAKYRGTTYLNRTSQIRASAADDAYVVAGSESGEVYIWDVAREEGAPLRGSGSRSNLRGDGSSSSHTGSGGGGGGGGGLSALLSRRANKSSSTSSAASTKSSHSSSSSSVGRSVNTASPSLTSSEICEFWTAAEGARPVTVALLAPLKTHAHLCGCEDPVEAWRGAMAAGGEGRRSSAGGVGTGATTALSALGLASALGAAMPGPLRSPSPSAGGPGSGSAASSSNGHGHGHLESGNDTADFTKPTTTTTSHSASSSSHGYGHSHSHATTSGSVSPGSVAVALPPGWNPRENRIVVSVDESQVLRVWRALRDERAILLE